MSNWDMPIQIASVQTLMRRTVPDVAVVLLDECHRWFKFYEKWLGTRDHPVPEWLDVPLIGPKRNTVDERTWFVVRSFL